MGQLQSAIEGLTVEPIESFTNIDLADSLVELEGAASRIEAERCRRLALFSTRKVYNEFEYSSPSAFLIDRCQITPSRATRLVANANALTGMPVSFARWREGVLAADQVRQLVACREADPDTFTSHEEMLCDTVSQLSVIDSGRVLTYWKEAIYQRNGADGAERLHARRRVHLSQTFEGMFRLDGYLDPLAGEIIREALDAATPPPAEGDARTPGQRRADALYDVARQALDQGNLPDSGGEKPHLLVLVGADRLHGSHVGLAETVACTVLSQSTLDLLACDCSISRIVFGPNSEITDVGRKTRIIPAALRRAVFARDRHCQHPGCYRPAKWCDIDHIIAWQDGGETKLDNLQLLCRYHHQLKHRGAEKQLHHGHQTAFRESRDLILVKSRK